MRKSEQKELAVIASIMSYNNFEKVLGLVRSTIKAHETIAAMAVRFHEETKDIPNELWEHLHLSPTSDDRSGFTQRWLSLTWAACELFDDCIDYEDVIVAYSGCDKVIEKASQIIYLR